MLWVIFVVGICALTLVGDRKDIQSLQNLPQLPGIHNYLLMT